MHVDPDLLALRALGEDLLDGTDLAHLDGCARCRCDAASLRQVASHARVSPTLAADRGTEAGNAAGHLTLSSTGPSPRVWQAIAAELDLSPTVSPTVSRAVLPGPAQDISGGAVATRRKRTGGSRRGRQPSRWRAVAPMALAASLAAVAAAGGTAAWLSRGQEQPQPQLAAGLAPVVSGTAGDGEAQVRSAVTGERTLSLTVDELPPTQGYHEVWLIDLQTGRMVSLGSVPGSGDTSYPLPPGLDLAEYDVVDISDEPLNGDPLHSGVSLLRGTLA